MGTVLSGSIDQSGPALLDDDQMGDGFSQTCVTYASSDVTIKAHYEDDFLAARGIASSDDVKTLTL